MKLTASLLAAAAVFCGQSSYAQNFNDVFCDSTLRLDLLFGGTEGNVDISLKQKHLKPGWAGRTHSLKKHIYAGNGDVTVMSLKGDTLYHNSFSSLFNEWLDLKEAEPASMEFVTLVPYPKDTVMVRVSLFDHYHKPVATSTFKVDPADILMRRNPDKPLPHAYVHKGSHDGDRIKVAVMGEGYTAAEMDLFMNDAKRFADALFAHEPFRSLQDRFDIVAVQVPSQQSGVSVPYEGVWKNTAFSSHFSTFYSDRYLTIPSIFAMHDALNGIDADHLVVLANVDTYGGGGIYNSYTLTSAHHPTFEPVAVHEFGHGFGGLADEYFYENDVMLDTYPSDVEPWEPNITTLVDFDSKWKHLLPEGTPIPTDPKDADKYPVGVYQGAGYSFHGVYRPADYCRMRINEIDHFCPACQASLERLIRFYTE